MGAKAKRERQYQEHLEEKYLKENGYLEDEEYSDEDPEYYEEDEALANLHLGQRFR